MSTPSHKTCTKCGEEKFLEEFYRDKRLKTGRRPDCKTCKTESHRKWAESNREHVKEYRADYYQSNREKILADKRSYHLENKDKRCAYARKYNADHKEEIRNRRRSYYELNRDEILADKKRYQADHRAEISARRRSAYQENGEATRARGREYYEENSDYLNLVSGRYRQSYTDLSREFATKVGTRWTEAEDAFLLKDNGMSMYQKSVELGRTYEAASGRRKRLRKELNHGST